MPTESPSPRRKQILAWAIAGVFVLGLFYSPVGLWTGAFLGVWFVGTQPPLRGFLLQAAFVFIPALCTQWRNFPLGSTPAAFAYTGWLLAGAALAVAPFLFHRLTSERLPGLIAPLPLALAAGVVHSIAVRALPPVAFERYFHASSSEFMAFLQHTFPAVPGAAASFIVYWFAAMLLYLWNRRFHVPAARIGGSAVIALALLAAASACGHTKYFPADAACAFLSAAAALACAAWAFVSNLNRHSAWASRTEILKSLQSPVSGEPLAVRRGKQGEMLTSPSGERYPIRNGIATVLRREDLNGLNGKYNRLYQVIGGFYDDIQRVVCALSGFDGDAYVRSYLGPLEVKPGDAVLETSVGTGLNFGYLPRGVRLCGLDLSPAMLARCQENLKRWGLEANLFLGNAESLPFADCSFDVVFHVGGINFFSDRARAIREMIRVAKPGTRILIADETEEHVRSNYEKFPLTRDFYTHRAEAVVAPADLVPAEMQEIHVELVKPMGKNRFYVLTFRKPAEAVDSAPASDPTGTLQAATL